MPASVFSGWTRCRRDRYTSQVRRLLLSSSEVVVHEIWMMVLVVGWSRRLCGSGRRPILFQSVAEAAGDCSAKSQMGTVTFPSSVSSCRPRAVAAVVISPRIRDLSQGFDAGHGRLVVGSLDPCPVAAGRRTSGGTRRPPLWCPDMPAVVAGGSACGFFG